MRKAAGIALSGIGILILVLGILLGTVWRPASVISGSTAPSGQGYVVTAPGVLDLTNRSVHISVTAPAGDEIRFATGYSDDVKAFTAGYTTQTVAGVSSVKELKVSSVEGKAPEGDLNDADMWLVKKSADGRLDVDYNVTLPGQEVLIASTASGAMPKVTLTWSRSVAPSLAVPTGLIGVLLILAGVLLFVLDAQRRAEDKRNHQIERSERNRREFTRRAETAVIPKIRVSDDELVGGASAPHAEEGADAPEAVVEGTPNTGEAEETSVERSAEEAAEVPVEEPTEVPAKETVETPDRSDVARATGGMLGVGIIPTSTRTEEIRSREFSPEAIAEVERARKAEDARGSVLNRDKSSTWWKFWGSKGEVDKDA